MPKSRLFLQNHVAILECSRVVFLGERYALLSTELWVLKLTQQEETPWSNQQDNLGRHECKSQVLHYHGVTTAGSIASLNFSHLIYTMKITTNKMLF